MNIDFLPVISFETAALAAGGALVLLVLARLIVGPPVGIARRWGLAVLRLLVVLSLLALFVNPVWVEETPGPVERPEVYFLVDSSQSMTMGTGTTRWDQVQQTIRDAQAAPGDSPARVSTFRFGQKLTAIDDQPGGSAGTGTATLASGLASLRPSDTDSRLVPALRQLSSRFGRSPPASVVLFSDGRIRDADGIDAIAEHYARQGVPIHVVPVGESAKGGDIAVVAVVAPARVRKYTSSEVQVFLRSFGYDGRRTEVRLEAMVQTGAEARPESVATPVPVTLRDGVQSVLLSYRSELDHRKLRVSIPVESDEVSEQNNTFPLEVSIDRTKVRVLYVEGSRERMRAVRSGDTYELRGPHTDLQKALTEDPDVECVVVVTGGTTRRQRLTGQQGYDPVRGFPETVAELAAFDAIILSNVQREAFTDQELEWIDQWVSRRGGGLCMVGGENSFGAGGWDGTPLETMLPVEIAAGGDWSPMPVDVEPHLDTSSHAVWNLLADAKQNREAVEAFPDFLGLNAGLTAKPNLTEVLASAVVDGAAEQPLLVAGQYGKGRTLAMSSAITAPWAADFAVNWGRGDNRYYAKFWRNAVYWLTENSSIGRRRLVITADKRFYRPGETVTLHAIAYDEGAARTTNYRIAAMIEPSSALLDLDTAESPVLWPNGLTRTSGESGPYVFWGEEFDLPARTDQKDYQLSLEVAKVLPAGSDSQSLRVEVTAYEDFTQVDSTSVDLQILHDPFESQNPFPDHELLAKVAEETGGRVLENGGDLAGVLGDLEVRVGPPVVSKEPVWSRWPVLALFLGLLTTEWIWRRGVGLA